ncbi:hypothetical protein F383_20178 [Gossypium arboreum]|uniref:Uncharacterized protein n=1 Tax=Gossypium arboreum TaxID=29729 RepID=A0A0B0NMT3_GOSAR|nr:hypothetical protein F383_20178 [Gossypium arboreum]
MKFDADVLDMVLQVTTYIDANILDVSYTRTNIGNPMS